MRIVIALKVIPYVLKISNHDNLQLADHIPPRDIQPPGGNTGGYNHSRKMIIAKSRQIDREQLIPQES